MERKIGFKREINHVLQERLIEKKMENIPKSLIKIRQIRDVYFLIP